MKSEINFIRIDCEHRFRLDEIVAYKDITNEEEGIKIEIYLRNGQKFKVDFTADDCFEDEQIKDKYLEMLDKIFNIVEFH